LSASNTLVQLLALYTYPERNSHEPQCTALQTETDRRTDDGMMQDHTV